MIGRTGNVYEISVPTLKLHGEGLQEVKRDLNSVVPALSASRRTIPQMARTLERVQPPKRMRGREDDVRPHRPAVASMPSQLPLVQC